MSQAELAAFRNARLPIAWFARDAKVVARALVGTFLVHAPRGDRARIARIVETEAYRGPTDAACHARAGLTSRTRALLGPPAHAYVFLVYGMHECFNVVCNATGKGHAVLVRAVEPVLGVDDDARTDGPGRLTRALGLSRAHDGASLVSAELFIARATKRSKIVVTPRVGVAYAGEIADAPWRFFDAASAYVSRPPARSIGANGPTASPTRRAAHARRPQT